MRAGLLPGVPTDPEGVPYELGPWSGDVQVAAESPLQPLPAEPPTRGPALMPPLLAYVFVGCLGLAVGSFLNVCIWRLPPLVLEREEEAAAGTWWACASAGWLRDVGAGHRPRPRPAVVAALVAARRAGRQLPGTTTSRS